MESHGLIKVTDDTQESKYRRVAKFLTIIGVDQAAKVISLLPSEMVDLIIPEIATIRDISPQEAESIMKEFQTLLDLSRQSGGVYTAKDMLERAYGPEKAHQMLEKAVPFSEGKPFSYLNKEDPAKIFLVLKDESDYIRSLVVSFLPSTLAASVIKEMTETQKKETLLRLAKLQKVDPDTVRRIDSAIHEKITSIQTEKTDSLDGRNALAAILKHMSPDQESSMLEKIADSDPELSLSLKEKLFTLDDIQNCTGTFLQNYLRTMENNAIALLIAGKNEAFRQKIFSNVSTGRGDMILEEEQLLLPVRKSDSDSATRSFLAVMRAAWERGDLFIPDRDEDEYVY